MNNINLKGEQFFSDTLFYRIGEQHADRILKETDTMLERYTAVDLPETLESLFSEPVSRKKCTQKFHRQKKASKNRVLIMTLVMLVSASGLFVVYSQVFKGMYHMILTPHTQYTEITFERALAEVNYLEQMPETWVTYFYLTHVPVDFSFISISGESENSMTTFQDSAGNELQFSQSPYKGVLPVKPENAIEVEQILKGQTALIWTMQDLKSIWWHTEEFEFSLSCDLEVETLVQLTDYVVHFQKETTF